MKNSAVRLTFLGGVNEVGGNRILIEDFNYDVKIFLDFEEFGHSKIIRHSTKPFFIKSLTNLYLILSSFIDLSK